MRRLITTSKYLLCFECTAPAIHLCNQLCQFPYNSGVPLLLESQIQNSRNPQILTNRLHNQIHIRECRPMYTNTHYLCGDNLLAVANALLSRDCASLCANLTTTYTSQTKGRPLQENQMLLVLYRNHRLNRSTVQTINVRRILSPMHLLMNDQSTALL